MQSTMEILTTVTAIRRILESVFRRGTQADGQSEAQEAARLYELDRQNNFDGTVFKGEGAPRVVATSRPLDDCPQTVHSSK